MSKPTFLSRHDTHVCKRAGWEVFIYRNIALDGCTLVCLFQAPNGRQRKAGRALSLSLSPPPLLAFYVYVDERAGTHSCRTCARLIFFFCCSVLPYLPTYTQTPQAGMARSHSTISLKEGRSAASCVQQARTRSAYGWGQSAGSGGRSPRLMTAATTCTGCMPS